MPPEFTDGIQAAALAGAGIVQQYGTSDVTLARNKALTAAVRQLRADTRFDVVLLVDSDQGWAPESALALAAHVRFTGHAASACYIMSDGRLAGHPHKDRWITGLGFLAIPRRQLLDLAEMSERFSDAHESDLIEFTSSGVQLVEGKRKWLGEDYTLCLRLGGVDLVPIAVTHIKAVPLTPHMGRLDESLRQRLSPLHSDEPTNP